MKPQNTPSVLKRRRKAVEDSRETGPTTFGGAGADAALITLETAEEKEVLAKLEEIAQ